FQVRSSPEIESAMADRRSLISRAGFNRAVALVLNGVNRRHHGEEHTPAVEQFSSRADSRRAVPGERRSHASASDGVKPHRRRFQMASGTQRCGAPLAVALMMTSVATAAQRGPSSYPPDMMPTHANVSYATVSKSQT